MLSKRLSRQHPNEHDLRERVAVTSTCLESWVCPELAPPRRLEAAIRAEEPWLGDSDARARAQPRPEKAWTQRCHPLRRHVRISTPCPAQGRARCLSPVETMMISVRVW
eukprot:1742738-Rhodomonas_salina.2